MTLLRWLWTAQLVAHPARAATAVIAIAIGVALGLGIHLVNRSALDEFDAAIAVVNAEAQASLRAAAGSFDETIYAGVATDPAIAAASPLIETDVQVLSVEGPVATPATTGVAGDPAPRAAKLRVIGLDAMRAAQVTPSLLPSPADETRDGAGSASDLFADDAIFLSDAATQSLGARIGDLLRVRSGAAEASLRVAGTVPGAAAGQRLAVMDIGAAQWRLGWIGRLSRIDLRLAAGLGASQAPKTLADRLPPDVVWSTPEASRQRMSNLSRAYRVNLNVLALVALFTGAFIVYSTVALGVLRQQQELALLGVLGASRRLLAAAVLGQGAVLGVLGAALGVAGGIGLAWAMLRLVGGDLGGGYFQGSAPPLSLAPLPLSVFALLGVTAGMAGSVMPAWSMRNIAPARALRPGATERRRHGVRGAILATALFAAGGVLVALPPLENLPLPAYLAIAAWLFAGIALVPLLTRALGTMLAHRALGSWHWPAAWLALQRVRGAPGGAAAALAGVVASVALASAMAIMVHSFRVSVDRWLDTVLPADIYGRSGEGAARAALDGQAQQRLRSLPGVARTEFLRAIELDLNPSRPPVTLLARPLADIDVRQRLPLTGELLAAPAGRIPIHVSEAMVDLYGFAPGRSVALPLAGVSEDDRRFFVTGVWRDYARQHGAIVIDEADYRRITGDDSVSDIALWLAPGADAGTVLDGLRRSLPELASVDFRSAQQIRALSLRIFDRSFAVTYALEAIALLVGLFGVAATYSGEALARAREFGMLRHLGVTRAQIGRMFAFESTVLITAGVAWGSALGVLIALVLIHRVNPQSFHWTMDTAWPVGLLLSGALALVALGVVSAVIASRAATGASPLRAVRSDW